MGVVTTAEAAARTVAAQVVGRWIGGVGAVGLAAGVRGVRARGEMLSGCRSDFCFFIKSFS
jgi:hypothetical protein